MLAIPSCRTTTVDVVVRVGPAVVNVTSERLERQGPFRPFAGDPFFDSFFRDFFEPRMPCWPSAAAA